MTLEPQLVTREPYNAETPLEALAEPTTPTEAFYVRNHFPVPRLDGRAWSLTLGGALSRPLTITLERLRSLPARTLDVVMECAGNGRTRLRPQPPGTPWGENAVGCASFRGTPLAPLLQEAGLKPEAVELLFEGADRGVAHGHAMSYERSLPVAAALHPDTLLVYEMNGEPLTPDHGAPVRLLVPGWYGMASVKWLTKITAITEPFQGFFQAEHYVTRPSESAPGVPVTRMRLKSLLTSPAPSDLLNTGEPVLLTGKAWSGEHPVARVRVSVDAGRTWRDATLRASAGPYAWREFELAWTPEARGDYTVLCQAIDEAGNAQPLVPEWNTLGYQNNAVLPVTLSVE
ncbi:MAG TPA: sulfite oxidase [Candidatus Thermoplasmatota archaeon]|nr:sulfite oxidase [Candidatus Thermoplasmatota archaeon]